LIEVTFNLGERDGEAFLGVGIAPPRTRGISGFIFKGISKVKDPAVYYSSKLGSLGTFIYDLLWWVILVSISVALVNMIPVGMFDGGRFFYLSVWGITGSEKIGKQAFAISTWLTLLLVALLMLRWVMIFF